MNSLLVFNSKSSTFAEDVQYNYSPNVQDHPKGGGKKHYSFEFTKRSNLLFTQVQLTEI